MARTRLTQFNTIGKADFRGIVEASVMKVAYAMLQADKSDPNYEQRAGLSRLLFDAATPPSVKDGYFRLFAWYAVNVPAIQTESAGGATPANINDETIDDAVRDFWDVAANVQPEPTAPPPVE